MNEFSEIGKFDIILCMGVLHHLSNPIKGLKNIKNVLEKDGIIFLYLYGKLGGHNRMLNKRLISTLLGKDNSNYERGMLFCGTGAGMAIVANKVKGVRAVCINDPYTAERAIASNNAQVVTMGTLITGSEVAKKLVDIWLSNEFQGGGSAKKVDKINNLDQI